PQSYTLFPYTTLFRSNMKAAMEAVQDTHAICEAAICYTGDILDPARSKYSLKYYVALAKKLEQMGAHFLAIKDMAGLCRPYAALDLKSTRLNSRHNQI